MADVEMKTEEMTNGTGGGLTLTNCDEEEGMDEVDYVREMNLKIMKHRKDVARTNMSSKRSEAVKEMSLDDIIAERKIGGPPPKKSWERKNSYVDRDFYDDDVHLSLDQILHKKERAGRPVENKSLDEIINERKEKQQPARRSDPSNSDSGTGESVGLGRKRKFEDTPKEVEEDTDFYVPSPLEVIQQLSEEGLVIENQVFKQTNTEDGRAHNWRVKFSCGSVEVQCEAPRKILAKQGAALELIKGMREVQGAGCRIPQCRIPVGCFYDPMVIDKLNEVCQSMDLEMPRFETVQGRKHGRDYFKTTFYIGEDEFIGKSYKIDESKLLGAKNAYETFEGKVFPKDKFFVGAECALDKEYTAKETEAIHVLTINSRAPVDPLPQSYFPVLDAEDEEELLVDSEGQVFARAEGSNKIRRLNPTTIGNIIEEKLMQMVGVEPSVPTLQGLAGAALIEDDEDGDI